MKVTVDDFEGVVFMDRKTKNMFLTLNSQSSLVTKLEILLGNFDNNGISPGNTAFDSLVVELTGGGKDVEVGGGKKSLIVANFGRD